jgi:diguanylate cyclase (GGDEF)-like protein/PAS domain S-box-containing protein
LSAVLHLSAHSLSLLVVLIVGFGSTLLGRKRLPESERRYRLLFEQNAAGVCVISPDGAISECNHAFASLIGCDRLELAGQKLRDLYVRPFEYDDLFGLVLTLNVANGVESEITRRDGGTITLLQNFAMIGSGSGATIHATAVDISARKRAEEQIEFHAYHDVVTKLPNRKLFIDRLTQNLTHAKRSSQLVAVLYIDIDHLKKINDLLGHAGGDNLLLEMAARLRHCVREEDTIARIGSDEFAIIITEMRRPEDAVAIAQKILEIVQLPVMLSGTVVDVTASIGLSLYPVDGTDSETLLLNAESAMDRAKEAGRNTYQLCTDEMKTSAIERLSLEARLRRAITNDELFLVYQPQIHLASGRVIGAEALVRWNDPERGVVQPVCFIPMAEESRLIVPLGVWVLREACRQMRQWLEDGVAMPRVSVNLSARQFQQHDLVATVRSALAEYGLDGSVLDLEITETTAMQNAEVTAAILRSLLDLGVGISIDDFGTGYSSLNYLKRFPIHAVKIDRSFVSEVSRDESDAAIVAAVIGMARSLKLRVVAEGLETAEQFDFLRQLGCDEAQGFFFSRPVLPEQIPPFLLHNVIAMAS